MSLYQLKNDPRFHTVRNGLSKAGFDVAAETLVDRWNSHPEKDKAWLNNYWKAKA